jgi:predicted glycosyltransferase
MAHPLKTIEPEREMSPVETQAAPTQVAVAKKIWIDLDNSPHVPFFLPIIEKLRERGHKVILTARDSYQVCELLNFHHISCKVIGSHWGKYRALKVIGTLFRAAQLVPFILSERPDLAVSHGSRAQLLSSTFLRIPTLTLADYEFTAKVGFLRPDWVFLAQFVPDSNALKAKKQVMKYPGLKEDVYIPRFRPDLSLSKDLGLSANELVVTVRPPATEAHYHNPEGEVLLDAALHRLVDRPEVRVILLPRNERQAQALRKGWEKWIQSRKIIIPEHVVDGLNLIWISDLVISGGGTMNREAAALRVPVYSIFRGRIGGVDKYLAEIGRLVLIESVEDVRTKIKLERRKAAGLEFAEESAALNCIVAGINSVAERQCLQAQL